MSGSHKWSKYVNHSFIPCSTPVEQRVLQQMLKQRSKNKTDELHLLIIFAEFVVLTFKIRSTEKLVEQILIDQIFYINCAIFWIRFGCNNIFSNLPLQRGSRGCCLLLLLYCLMGAYHMFVAVFGHVACRYTFAEVPVKGQKGLWLLHAIHPRQ